MVRSSTVAIILASTLAACSAEGVSTDTLGPDASVPDDVEQGVPLEVDRPNASTNWPSIPVTGHGPANGTLVFTTPGGGQFTKNLTASGDFCVDVGLASETVNRIKFEAINAAGDYSDPIIIEVRQDGVPPETNPSPDPLPGYTNIASGASITDMSVTIETGAVAAIVDGDTSGAVSIRNAVTTADWMVIELTERLPIQQIHIETSSDCPMENYRILLNDDPNSGDPMEYSWYHDLYVYGSGWSLIGEVEQGSTDETIQPTIGDPRAQRLAIEFLSSDCGPLIGSGRHKITEIEVWARADNEPGGPGPTSGAPSCSNSL